MLMSPTPGSALRCLAFIAARRLRRRSARRADRRRFSCGARRVSGQRCRGAGPDRAAGQRPFARALRRLLAVAPQARRCDARARALVSRPQRRHAAGRHAARRMAEVAGQACALERVRRRLSEARRRRYRARLLRSAVAPRGESRRGLADARQYWFSGRDQPESCEPLFAELEATRPDHAGRHLEPLSAGARGGQFSARGAARAASCRPTTARRPPTTIASSAIPGPRWPKASFASAPAAAASSRSTRSTGSREATPRRAHRAWVRWRARLPEADRRYGNLLVAYNAAQAAAARSQRLVSRSR